MANTDPSVERLIRELQVGHNREENCESLFKRYYPPLKTFFHRRGVPEQDCHDLIQETLIKAFQGLARIQDAAKFNTWLYSIAANVWKNALRGQATKMRDAAEVPLEQDLVKASEPNPEQRALTEERARLEHQALRQAVEELAPQMRRCLLLRLDRQLKYREIAEVLGIEINTVKSLIHEAKKRLRKNLGDRFPELGY